MLRGFFVTESSHGQRVALITGANRGIGFEICRQLGKQGITILAAARDLERGHKEAELLRGEEIAAHAMVLDVTKQPTIDAAAAAVTRDYGKLDILANNAGILLERKEPTECEAEKLRAVMETNVIGVFAVTKAFLPLLRKSAAGRIVNLSSGLGSLAYLSDPNRYENHFMAYAASKAALNAITVAFARELSGTSIKVNAVAPGYTRTEMNNYLGTQTVEQDAAAPVQFATLGPDRPSGIFVDSKGIVPW